MNFEIIKAEYRMGEKLSVLSKKYDIPINALRYRAKKEGWNKESGDCLSHLRSAADSTARLLEKISRKNEELLSEGREIDPRDIKYITAAEKELLEVMRDIFESPNRKERNEDFIRFQKVRGSGEEEMLGTGIVLLPEVNALGEV
jgi:hypothetical protein